MTSLNVVLVSTLIFGSCANKPPPIQTNERPTILDHPLVLSVSDFDQHRTPGQFLSAMESGETFGYCLPVGSSTGRVPVLCLVTELGEAYMVFDHTMEDEPKALYEIASVVRRKGTKYLVPSFDIVGDFKE